jgi:ABC-type uncharacterized transport system permease subunit
MLVTVLFIATGVLYGAACAAYLGYLIKGVDAVGRWATRILVVAAASHLAYFASDFVVLGHDPASDIHQTLSLASLLIVVAYLLASLKYRIAVLGGFITPVTLLFLMGAGLGRSVSTVSPEVRSILLPVHISVNVLGIVAFTLAFAAGLAYLIQEALLRRRRLGGVFQRLPALDVLDSLGFRLVTIGFPLLTAGIIMGTFLAVRLDPETPAISPSQSFAVLSWLVFAAVLLLRVAAGWRGRRAAIGTLVGFACETVVLVGYMLRASGGAG